MFAKLLSFCGLRYNPWEDDSKPKSNRTPSEFKLEMPPIFQKFGNKILIIVAITIILTLYLLTGLYKINPDENGIVVRFNAYNRTAGYGLHYHLPRPFEKVYKVKFTRINKIQIGFRGSKTSESSVEEESLMLTKDENIVDINFEVQWQIKDAKDFVFNLRNQVLNIKNIAESSMREVVAKTLISEILSTGRSQVEYEVKTLLQSILDDYNSGVDIVLVQLLRVDPPRQVINAFRDVQTARADKERNINEAQAYENSILPQAEGEAEKITQSAESYSAQVLAEAMGESSRFNAMLREYRKAKIITKKRIYIDTMKDVMENNNVTVVDGDISKSGVIPLMSLAQKK